MSLPFAAAPSPSFRLIPSQFPPIAAFDTVATGADAEAVMELAGWTNDRLVAERLARLTPSDWVFGRANASVVMASFLHVAPEGARFNGPDLGAWYAAAALPTAVAEVAHHLRREAVARRVSGMSRRFRTYLARLDGEYLDLRGRRPEIPEAYGEDYAASQAFGEARRAEGDAGLVYDSLRHAGGVNAAAFRPRDIVEVIQADHYEITVQAQDRRIEARRLAG